MLYFFSVTGEHVIIPIGAFESRGECFAVMDDMNGQGAAAKGWVMRLDCTYEVAI